MSWREDHHTSNLDAAAAFEDARAYHPTRLELAEEAGYEPDPDYRPAGYRSANCPPHLAAALLRASELAAEAWERDREWLRRNGRVS